MSVLGANTDVVKSPAHRTPLQNDASGERRHAFAGRAVTGLSTGFDVLLSFVLRTNLLNCSWLDELTIHIRGSLYNS